MRWVCPACEREFDRSGQVHTCSPGNSVAQTFRGFPDGHLQACEAVLDFVGRLGPVHVDAVRVGVFLKTQRTLAEVRPKRTFVSLEVVLPEVDSSPRITRHHRMSDLRVVHWIRLHGAGDVDDEVKAWLTRAYDAATG